MKESTSANIAKHLKHCRKVKGLTQDELSDRSGISRQSLSKHENGKVAPTDEHLERYAQALEVPIDYLKHGVWHNCGFEVYTELIWQKQ